MAQVHWMVSLVRIATILFVLFGLLCAFYILRLLTALVKG